MKKMGKSNGKGYESISRRSSFTLIELLVVVAIILILLGMSLKIMSLVNRRGSTARTTWILEQVKNALGAYYATYGTYPPTDNVPFVYEGLIPPPTDVIIPQEKLQWSTGLVYYIFSGAGHNPEAARWQHYLEGIGGTSMDPRTNVTVGAWRGGFTNRIHTISDAWGQTLRYSSPGPEYQRFTLWSVGPNGINENGGGDDIGVQWSD